MQQQQKQSTPLPHRGLLSQKRQRLQVLLLLAELQQIVANSMLVVVSIKDFTSIQMAGKLEVPYSLMAWDTEILTTALPVLLCTSVATSGQPGLHPRPSVVSWASVRASCTRRM